MAKHSRRKFCENPVYLSGVKGEAFAAEILRKSDIFIAGSGRSIRGGNYPNNQYILCANASPLQGFCQENCQKNCFAL
jgi:hypothetical protein